MEIVNRKRIIWYALAHATVLESIRRKDIYVAAILCVILFGAASTIGSFGVKGLEIFFKDVALTVIGLLSTVLAVLLSARQIAEEVSRRTVYPLLARPISRADLLIGKFLGAYFLSVFALLLFATVSALCLSLYNIPLGAVFLQYLLLRAFGLAVLCAMTLMVSLFLTPEATVTISLLLAVGSATFADAVKLLYPGSEGAKQAFLKAVYYVVPQLNLFDMGKKVSYGWSAVPGWVIGALFAYAVMYVALFLFIGTLRFKRQAL
ncbi:MAG: ABC transporter permease [Armatimonadetes bacterium]|nr:ABC transporter permease [Armatimonadota bacterium]